MSQSLASSSKSKSHVQAQEEEDDDLVILPDVDNSELIAHTSSVWLEGCSTEKDAALKLSSLFSLDQVYGMSKVESVEWTWEIIGFSSILTPRRTYRRCLVKDHAITTNGLLLLRDGLHTLAIHSLTL